MTVSQTLSETAFWRLLLLTTKRLRGIVVGIRLSRSQHSRIFREFDRHQAKTLMMAAMSRIYGSHQWIEI